ncbi:hypothetical protein FRB99_001292 [Tulasnella sp. 403]|nr:hypothetical protein FRB99_001292 [Tulasnella sp. 403]
MRFPSAEDAKNFQAAFEKAQIAYPGAVQSPTLTSPTMPFGPGDVVQSPVSMPSAPGMPQWPASPADTTKPPVGGSAADLVKPVAALSIHKKGTTSIDTKQEEFWHPNSKERVYE